MRLTDRPFLCAGCGERFWHDPLENVITRGEQKGCYIEWANVVELPVCYYCYESDTGDGASTLVRFDPDGSKLVARFGDLFAFDPEYGGDPGPWFWDIVKARNYVRTDGWRGYFDTKLHGLEVIEEGWVTGYPDETVSYKASAAELYAALNDGEVDDLPAPLYWLFEPTSNVFSTACTVATEPEYIGAIRRWLADDDVDLHTALS
jgi:hypothetical protein